MDGGCKRCAIACVGGDTLNQYLRQFRECGGDMDALFTRDTGDDDFYRIVIEKGRVYETGYPRCICWDNSHKGGCECSRQALIYLYSQMLHDMEFTVETLQTIRGGAESCKFWIILVK